GAPWEIAFVTVGIAGPDGAARHFENYELADMATALRRFDELAAERAGSGENLVARTLARSVAALNRRDWQGFVDAHGPGFVFFDNRRGVRLRQEGDERFTTYELFLTFDDFTFERMPIA